MLKVGITGGIGSGKSVVCNVFKSLFIPVYDADFWAKELMNTDLEIKKQLTDFLGEQAYTNNGLLNKPYISARIFSDSGALQKINSIVHPRVILHYKNWHNSFNTVPYTVKEAAILFESGAYKDSDLIITVIAPENERINRVMLRDNITADIVKKKMAAQWPDEEKIKKSNYVIENRSDKAILPQVLSVHNLILKSNH